MPYQPPTEAQLKAFLKQLIEQGFGDMVGDVIGVPKFENHEDCITKKFTKKVGVQVSEHLVAEVIKRIRESDLNMIISNIIAKRSDKIITHIMTMVNNSVSELTKKELKTICRAVEVEVEAKDDQLTYVKNPMMMGGKGKDEEHDGKGINEEHDGKDEEHDEKPMSLLEQGKTFLGGLQANSDSVLEGAKKSSSNARPSTNCTNGPTKDDECTMPLADGKTIREFVKMIRDNACEVLTTQDSVSRIMSAVDEIMKKMVQDVEMKRLVDITVRKIMMNTDYKKRVIAVFEKKANDAKKQNGGTQTIKFDVEQIAQAMTPWQGIQFPTDGLADGWTLENVTTYCNDKGKILEIGFLPLSTVKSETDEKGKLVYYDATKRGIVSDNNGGEVVIPASLSNVFAEGTTFSANGKSFEIVGQKIHPDWREILFPFYLNKTTKESLPPFIWPKKGPKGNTIFTNVISPTTIYTSVTTRGITPIKFGTPVPSAPPASRVIQSVAATPVNSYSMFGGSNIHRKRATRKIKRKNKRTRKTGKHVRKKSLTERKRVH
jgi:hypothetical protein